MASVFATFNSVVAGTIGIIVKYKNVLIVAASAAGGYAVAANASAIATGAYTVATKIATIAQRTFNAVVKANPINVKKPTDEIVGLNTIEPIEEPTKEIEEPTEPVKRSEDIRRDLDETKINKTKIKTDMRNEKNLEMCEEARLLTEYKDKVGLKNVFHDLDLTVDVVNYLYSSEYIEGVDIKMDDKKASVDVIINQKINPLRGLPMVFTL